jgi:hypothetical protein
MGGIIASEAADLSHPAAERPKLGIIDCDVHPFPIDGAASIMRYLPKPWRERVLRKGSFTRGLIMTVPKAPNSGTA